MMLLVDPLILPFNLDQGCSIPRPWAGSSPWPFVIQPAGLPNGSCGEPCALDQVSSVVQHLTLVYGGLGYDGTGPNIGWMAHRLDQALCCPLYTRIGLQPGQGGVGPRAWSQCMEVVQTQHGPWTGSMPFIWSMGSKNVSTTELDYNPTQYLGVKQTNKKLRD